MKTKGVVFSGTSIVCGGLVVKMSPELIQEIMGWIILIIGVISAVLSIVNTILSWYKKAKEDGKVTVDELIELNTELQREVDRLNLRLMEKEEDKDVSQD